MTEAPTSNAPKRRRARWLIAAMWIAFVIVLAEIVSLAFWVKKGGVMFTRATYIYNIYPELRRIDRIRPRADDETFDLLVLGGSVLHPDWSDAIKALDRQLSAVTRRPIRIHNVAFPGQTTRDSLRKYRHLRPHGFDAVTVYHGINDAGLNNCPAEVFREDYTHSLWYTLIDRVDHHPKRRLFTLPATIDYMLHVSGENLLDRSFLPDNREDWQPIHYEWLKYGADVKTAGPFQRNLQRIADLAAEKGEPLILMTFAYHYPENYSYERFMAKQLDYGTHRIPANNWGIEQNVLAAIDAHNLAIRAVAAEMGAPLIDQHALMPKSGKFFDDVCHLSRAGSERFAANLVEVIKPLLQTEPADADG